MSSAVPCAALCHTHALLAGLCVSDGHTVSVWPHHLALQSKWSIRLLPTGLVKHQRVSYWAQPNDEALDSQSAPTWLVKTW